jgi:hypothetical protein
MAVDFIYERMGVKVLVRNQEVKIIETWSPQ